VVIGLFNSFVILKMKVTPFIATISMMFVVRGLANFASNGYSIYPLSEQALTLGYAKPLGVSWAFVAFLIIITIAHIVMEYSLFGLLTRATGSDREVAICTEVDVDKVNAINLVAISLLAGIAGIFISFMLNAGAPTVGTGWEFTAITACAIGGVSLFGYHGNMFGLFCGLAVIQVIQNGIVMIGVSPHLQSVFVGGILLIAMAVDVRRRTYLNLDRV
jgi:ribose transport system permease protein